MKNRRLNLTKTVGTAVLVLFVVAMAEGQTPAYRAPRTADGKPNLNGIWQAMNTANWDIRPHAAYQGPVAALGAQFSVPAGVGVIDGEDLPYLPEAAAKQKENFNNRLALDPEIRCYMPGVPRATYMPFPFQIVQSAKTIMIAYEYAGAARTIYMVDGPSDIDKAPKAPAESWMGWSVGYWEGDTLVVQVTDMNDATWFDRAGNFHSDALRVVERYTPRSPETLSYEATIEDPKTFSRPFKVSMPLYRHVEKNAQLLEYKCPVFAEEVMYGQWRKKTQ